MLSALAPLALAAVVAAAPQGAAVTANIAPSSTAGPSCSPNYAGAFQIQLLNATSVNKRSLGIQQRAAGDLFITLSNGVLKDSQGRTGYIAANRQFQFDGPAQAGAIYTAGWTVCSNGSLAIGADALFDACLSGEFYNLYDENAAPQCSRVYIQAVKAVSGGVTQIGDGQVQASGAVTQIGDGQIQAPTGVVTQIGDGQIQAPTGVVTQIGDGQIQAPTGVVTQIADGQIQAPTGNITTAKPTTVPYTGAASTLNGAAAGLVGALMVAVAML